MGSNISKDPGGEPVFVRGTVRNTQGNPVNNATLDIWQTSAEGFYDVQDDRQSPMNLCGLFKTSADGQFCFTTIKPSSYPIPTDGPVGEILAAMGRSEMRPAHVHFIVAAKGFDSVTTQLFVAGDQYLESDAVFGVKESLIVPFTRHNDPGRAKSLGIGNPSYILEHDFVLSQSN